MKSFRTFTLFVIAILSVVLLIFLPKFIGSNNLNKNNESKEVQIDITNENATVDLIDFKINPGEEKIYQIKMNASAFKTYDFNIWFESESELINDLLFVYVKYNTTTTEKYDISTLNFDNQLSFSYSGSLMDNSFDLIFYMNEAAGNEAQNLSLDFKTCFSVKG